MKKFLLAAGCVAMMASAVSAKDYVISKVDMTQFTESTYTYDNKEKSRLPAHGAPRTAQCSMSL